MKNHVLAITSVALLISSANVAAAATAKENTGVVSGALVGAAAGGPVGLIVGAALGGHYANRSERLERGALQRVELDAQIADATTRLATARTQLANVEANLAARAQTLQEQSQRIDALLEDQALLTQLGVQVQFATNVAALTARDEQILATLGQYLARHPELAVRLHGHTDARGALSYNDDLSAARAGAVAQALRDNAVAPAQIEALGHGERQATAPAYDVDALARERRVDVELVQPEDKLRRASRRQD